MRSHRRKFSQPPIAVIVCGAMVCIGTIPQEVRAQDFQDQAQSAETLGQVQERAVPVRSNKSQSLGSRLLSQCSRNRRHGRR